MLIPDDEMITYASKEEAIADLEEHGWTVLLLPNDNGWYAFNVIATHPTCGASPLALECDSSRPHTVGHRWWWADFVKYRGPRMWRISGGGTTEGQPMWGQLRHRHQHRRWERT